MKGENKMNRHSVKLILLLTAGMTLFVGCFSSKYMIPPTDLRKSDSGPMAVLTLDGTIYDLDRGVVGTTSVDGEGIRYSVEGAADVSLWSIPISEIELVETGRIDVMKHWLITGSIVALAVAAGIATGAPGDATGESDVHDPNVPNFGSCPFVFTFDGEKYHFESETFAGAVCRSLEYSNIERLDYLREVDGAFHLVIANQQPESQFVNELALFAVNHAPGTQVIPDIAGQIRTVRRPVAPLFARDLGGRDLTEYVEAVDGRMWESELDTVDLSVDEHLRDRLVCEFPKPEGATQAKLIINGKNSPLANFALETMFSQDEVERLRLFHQFNTNEEEREEFVGWINREAGLDILLWTNGRWEKQGWFPNVGPFITAEKIVELDIGNVNTENITVRIETARDLWCLDRIAMDFSDDEDIAVIPLTLRSATTESGADVTHLFAESDSLYYGSMPGDYAQLVFDVHGENPNLKRSLVMKSRGYYYKWAQPYAQEISRETIERVLREPLYGNRILLPQWREVKAQYTSRGSRRPHFEID
jgi:hypothetical protein